ncbi:hypothetical protein Dimus_028467 [Dionaea muscipula]
MFYCVGNVSHKLKSLYYAEGIVGCHFEFFAYNLIGVILLSNSRRDLLASMSSWAVVIPCRHFSELDWRYMRDSLSERDVVVIFCVCCFVGYATV